MDEAENTAPPQQPGLTDESTTTVNTPDCSTKRPNGDVTVETSTVNSGNASVVKQEDDVDDSSSGPPQGKKRKLAEINSTRPSRAVSPPWKRIAIDGPTSFVEEGKRRSARTNVLPLELQPHSTKRKTRAALQEHNNSIRSRYGNNVNSRSMPATSTPAPVYGKNIRSTSKSNPQQGTRSSAREKHHAPHTTPTKRSSRRLGGYAEGRSSPTAPKREFSLGKRRASRLNKVKKEEEGVEVMTNGHKTETEGEEDAEMDQDDDDDDDDGENSDLLSEMSDDLPLDPDFKPQRLKFKIKMPSLTAQHPAHIPATKRFSSFREWVEKDNPYDGPTPSFTDDQIRKEARSRQRVYDSIHSGSLSRGLSSLDVPDPQPEPPRQYFRHDHFMAHALDMRKRMLAEKRRHVREAKRLADDLKAYWQALQPKSEEDVQREKDEATEAKSHAILRQCIHDLGLKWEIMRAEVDKQRLAVWEQEQEALGKEALNKVLEQSTQLLDARIRRDSSDMSSEDEEEENDNNEPGKSSVSQSDEDDSDNEDEANMSSSETEEEEQSEDEQENPDENLTLEELHRKYNQDPTAHVDRPPETPIHPKAADVGTTIPGTVAKMTHMEAVLDDRDDMDISSSLQRTLRGAEHSDAEQIDDAILDESDESIDMDDDMGSSDERSELDDEEEDGSSEEDEGDPSGTLGFYLSKSDLVASTDSVPQKEPEDTNEVPIQEQKQEPYVMPEEEDEDEISLIPDAAEVQTPSASIDGSGHNLLESQRNSAHDSLSIPYEKNLNLQTQTLISTRSDNLERDKIERSFSNQEKVVDDAGTPEQEHRPPSILGPESVAINAVVDIAGRSDDQDAFVQTTSDVKRGSDQQSPVSSPPNQTSQETQSVANDRESAVDTNTDSLPATPSSLKPLKTSVPSLLRGTLREYQHFGLDWLSGLYVNGTNGILADEMGLGKTIQTIALLAHLAVEHHEWGPHLIVVPTSVMLNWEMEFKKFLPGFKVMTYYGSPEERKQRRKGWLNDDKWNVVITSYQLVLQDQVSFKKRGWHYLVLDEAHNIKNFRSQRWQTLLSFRTAARLLLTGTPLQNNLTELWSLMFFLMPSDSTETGITGFAQLDEFSSWFKKPVDQILEQGRDTMDEEAKQVVKRLHSVLRPYLLRRLKADVEKQMPAKYEHVVYCKLSKRQRYLYDGFMSRASTRETLASGNYMSIINCLMQLRKVCNHPDLFETRQIVTSFAMPNSVIADYEIKDFLVRRRLLEVVDEQVSLDAVNLLPGSNGPTSALDTLQPSRLKAIQNMRWVMGDLNREVQSNLPFNGTSTETALNYMENDARKQAWNDLHHKVYLTSLRSQRRPLMSHALINRLKINLKPFDTSDRSILRERITENLLNRSNLLEDMVLDLPTRAAALETTIQKFSFVTPNAVARDVGIREIAPGGAELIRRSSRALRQDPFHESRMRLSIAFPDKRLLQYDCGKLQRLDSLLRTLQAGGHRALIFTQMTKVLDILEQFLNIHGHRYLRLDGSTKIEQRQILTDRFNNDSRILAFILSSRSGGLGINLTGADTVIFYDLDWNPAMDKQCQDRCHRIGQTRDVHIYRFVSEYTIEANILRKSNQKRMLDDVIIQEGEFTTDFFHKPNPRDAFDDETMHEADAEASAAMDRILGAGSEPGKSGAKIFEQAEDKEDIAAAHVAEKEVQHADEADFSERTPAGGATPKTSRPMTPGGTVLTPAARASSPADDDVIALEELKRGVVLPRTDMSFNIFEGREVIGVDRHIVEHLEWELKGVPFGPPLGERKKKKVGEHVLKRKR